MYPVTAQTLADGRRWEGSSLIVYPDSRGYATQGIGRHSGVAFGDPAISETTELQWFGEDWRNAYTVALTLVPRLDEIDEVRRNAIIWCAFNMGVTTLSQFAPFIRFVRLGKWSDAAFHLLTNMSGHLTPYLEQTGQRAAETALRICSGEILDEFKTA